MRPLKNTVKALTIKIDPRTTTGENIKIESDLPLRKRDSCHWIIGHHYI